MLHIGISLDDFVALIKAFIDMLILASGCQSSGRPAIWDADNIEKAVRWGLFIEDVLKRLHGFDDFKSSVEQLDEALLELTSSSLVPQGLGDLSSATLPKARDLILERLIRTDPLQELRFAALATAAIKIDADNLKTCSSFPNAYNEMLLQQMEFLKINPGNEFIRDPSASTVDSRSPPNSHHEFGSARSPPCISNIKANDSVGVTFFIIQELLTRQSYSSCVSLFENGLNVLSTTLARSSLLGLQQLNKKHTGEVPPETEVLTETFIWNQWRSRCVQYMLDNRTIRLLSGANLIFGAPKDQWIRVFEPLRTPFAVNNATSVEILELLLLGIISRRWNPLIEQFMSYTYHNLPIHRQWSVVHNLIHGSSHCSTSTEEALDQKEKDILEYLACLLNNQLHKLWELPPVLVGAALPSWSSVFRSYLADIQRVLDGSSSSRCCQCNQAGREHRNCEIADRIQCLYAFHILGVQEKQSRKLSD